MEVVAGQHVLLGAVPRAYLGPLGAGVVHSLQEVGHPRQLHLHGTHLQLGIALEYAGEDHIGNGQARPVVRVQHHRRPDQRDGLTAFQMLSFLGDARPVGAKVEAEGHFQVFGRGPERLVLGRVVALAFRGVDADHCPCKAHLCAPVHLRHTDRYVIQVDHGDRL